MKDTAKTLACIVACNDCRNDCEKALFTHCLEEGGGHTAPAHVRLMADCIQICQLVTGFILRGSEHTLDVCKSCADICDACADSCEQLEGPEMHDCGRTCRRAANALRSLCLSLHKTAPPAEKGALAEYHLD